MTRYFPTSAVLSLLFFCCLLAMARPASANTVTIGSSGCNYIGFQFMLDQLAGIPGPHVIKMRTQTFAIPDGITLNTSNTDYTFIGGYDSCSDASPTPGHYSTLDATGGNDGTTFAINGTSSSSTPQVKLRGLIIRGGSAETVTFANPEGGGLEIRGRIYVQLDDGTSVEDNASGKGGGVYLRGDNDSERAVLHMVGDSFVGYNDASAGSNSAGGGIHCEDHASVFLDDGQVSANTTDNLSAGISLKNNCVLDALIPTGGFAGVLFNEGYGILSEGPVTVSLKGRASTPFLIYGNTGTALSMGNRDSPRSTATLRSVAIMDNPGTRAIGLLGGVDLSMEPASGAGTCSYLGIPYNACSAIVGNGPAGTAQYAQLISTFDWFDKAPTLNLKRTLISGNRAMHVIRLLNEDVASSASIENSLIVDNQLFKADSFGGLPAVIVSSGATTASTPFKLRYTTISGNQVDSGGANLLDLHANPIELTGTLLYNPGLFVGGSSGPVTHGGCLLSHESSSFIGTPYFTGDPNLDAEFLPGLVSAALDRCTVAGAPFVDFHGKPRPVDQATTSNFYGAVDIGALERPQDGVTGTALFADGFE